MGWIIKITVLCAAFLLFQIELISAKKLLSFFGGGASVWTTCMVFFQFALLAGYGYALGLSALSFRRQRWIHGALLLLGAGAVLLTWRHSGNGFVPVLCAKLPPLAGILWALLISIGLPFFILSSTTSLLQSWWANRLARQRGQRPVNTFTLYSYSNAGSLLGLVSYPFLVEPSQTLATQTVVWSISFIAYAAVFAGLTLWSRGGVVTAAGQGTSPVNSQSVEVPRQGWHRFYLWVGLAALPSLTLLAVTTQLTVNVAPIPLLWMLPLTLYLVSFMICFSGGWRQNDELLGVVVLLAVIACAVARAHEASFGVVCATGIYCFGLLVVSVFCHGLLYGRRPEAGQIPRFYFAVALGGVLGGMVAGIIAPVCFKDYWEFPLALAVLTILVMTIWWRSPAAWLSSWRLPLTIMGCVALVLVKQSDTSSGGGQTSIQLESGDIHHPKVVTRQRNFYGVLQVLCEQCGPAVNVYSLLHGTICHGFQYDPVGLRSRPTAYFADATGLGLVMHALQGGTGQAGKSKGLRVGGLGMGIGTIAAYGREGDEYRFFEINPAVIRLATNSAPFTYIRYSEAKVDIVEGDARMSLLREVRQAGAERYDLLVLDTFSGDSIPVHCLTEQAFALYLSRLKENGVIAAHITNRYLDLVPVFAALKRHFGLEGIIVVTHGDLKISLDAVWVILTRNKAILDDPALKAQGRPEMETCKVIRMWTDDYSNLLDVLNWRQKVYKVLGTTAGGRSSATPGR